METEVTDVIQHLIEKLHTVEVVVVDKTDLDVLDEVEVDDDTEHLDDFLDELDAVDNDMPDEVLVVILVDDEVVLDEFELLERGAVVECDELEYRVI